MAQRGLYSSLAPNSTYYGNHGAVYYTDNWGRVTHAEPDAVAEQAPRNAEAQRTLEGKDPEFYRDAGHIFPSSQGGSGEKFNLTAQNEKVNQRDIHAFEQETDQMLAEGKQVHLKADITWPENGVAQPEAYLYTRETIGPNGEVVDREYTSMPNADMAQFPHFGPEAASLASEYDNPGAFIYDEEQDIAVNPETGAVVDVSDSVPEAEAALDAGPDAGADAGPDAADDLDP